MFTCWVAFIAEVTAGYACLGGDIHLEFYVKYHFRFVPVVLSTPGTCIFTYVLNFVFWCLMMVRKDRNIQNILLILLKSCCV